MLPKLHLICEFLKKRLTIALGKLYNMGYKKEGEVIPTKEL